MGETPMLLSGRAAGFPAFDGLGVALALPLNAVAIKAEQPHVVPCVAFAPPVQRLNMVNGWRLAVNMPKQIASISPQRCAAAHLANVPVSLEHGFRIDLRVVGNAILPASVAVTVFAVVRKRLSTLAIRTAVRRLSPVASVTIFKRFAAITAQCYLAQSRPPVM